MELYYYIPWLLSKYIYAVFPASVAHFLAVPPSRLTMEGLGSSESEDDYNEYDSEAEDSPLDHDDDFENEGGPIKHLEFFENTCSEQTESSLFTVPGEIRTLIYEHVFADYENLSDPYDMDTCFRRPGCFAPRRSDTELLQTCQMAYQEAWFMPWTSAQHTFYLAWSGRRPQSTTDKRQMAKACYLIHRLHPDIPQRRKETGNTQIFAQLCSIEGGNGLQQILDISHFLPRSITITIRHTDIWSWESDSPIHLDGGWVDRARFPDSVTELRYQLESLERRKAQVDHIMKEAERRWQFIRKDGIRLVASRDQPLEITKWTGSSTWEGQRWLRDESDEKPGLLDYHMVTATFRPKDFSEDRPMAASLSAPGEISHSLQVPVPCMNVSRIEAAGFGPNTPASQIIAAA